jgi:uncharacterized protein (TIGR02145 family)
MKKLLLTAAAVAAVVVCATAQTTIKPMACTDLVLTGTAATGSGTIYYQWVEGPTAATCTTPIAGCATQNCTIPAAKAVGTMVYKRVVVSDECITDIKESAPITVQYQGLKLGTVCWAPANVGNTGKWAQTPDTYGSFFQFNINRAWHPTTPAAGVAIISWLPSIDEASSWNENIRPVCPTGWRLPTRAEFQALGDAGVGTWAAANAKGNTVAGLLLGPNHASCSLSVGGSMDSCIFLPASGNRVAPTGFLASQGGVGIYWCGEQSSNTRGYIFNFNSTGTSSVSDNYKSNAYSVRCVKTM